MPLLASRVMAGIMALRPQMRDWERSLWFVVLVVFAAMEIRAIDRDRNDQTEKFRTLLNEEQIISQRTQQIEDTEENISADV
jgi:hypothetical protein